MKKNMFHQDGIQAETFPLSFTENAEVDKLQFSVEEPLFEWNYNHESKFSLR